MRSFNSRSLTAVFLSPLALAAMVGAADPCKASQLAETAAGIHFRIVNAGSRTLRGVYVSPSNDPRWGENLLGRGAEPAVAEELASQGLVAGKDVEITFAGECGLYDVRLAADKGVELIEEEVELCEDGDVVTIEGDTLIRARQKDLDAAGSRARR